MKVKGSRTFLAFALHAQPDSIASVSANWKADRLSCAYCVTVAVV